MGEGSLGWIMGGPAVGNGRQGMSSLRAPSPSVILLAPRPRSLLSFRVCCAVRRNISRAIGVDSVINELEVGGGEPQTDFCPGQPTGTDTGEKTAISSPPSEYGRRGEEPS